MRPYITAGLPFSARDLQTRLYSTGSSPSIQLIDLGLHYDAQQVGVNAVMMEDRQPWVASLKMVAEIASTADRVGLFGFMMARTTKFA